LVRALERNLDISNILDSSLCNYHLNKEEVEHFHTWAQFHTDCSSAIVNYDQSQMELLHDEDAYGQIFGDSFPLEESESKDKPNASTAERLE
jgi:hypothetical protein